MSLAKQMQHRDREMVPRILVQAMFALMAASLGIVAYAQWANVPQSGVLTVAPVTQQIDVVLTGDREGNYAVHDTNGQLLAASDEHLKGFIAVMGRSIEHQRKGQAIDMSTPIQVVRRENGNVSVIDPATGRIFELIGYGQDNVAAFAQLLN